MRSFWSDPYLWIHLAGLAALPLFLELCLIGFSVGDPFLPVWLELFLVAAIGIAPILWMQWQRPFYIFSLVAVALKPAQLTEDQRRLLTLFKSQRNQILAACVPVLLLLVLVKLHGASAIAISVVSFPVEWRGAGLLLAAIAFLGSNLFAQVPASVLSVMLNSEAEFLTTNPYPLEQIRHNFSLFGLQVNQILPPVILEDKSVPVVAPSVAAIATATDLTAPESPIPDGTQTVTSSPVVESAPEIMQPDQPLSSSPVTEDNREAAPPFPQDSPAEESATSENDIWEE
ncbi:low-complexity tail membrane protein [Kovacikia minuta CCNUW1]|uniref:low-complexity tail membrane protein n=1 Tax=Kovacikia minuta TaxID=2931930 RepID=UPI001CCEB01E|nr:low-complexity tail membrane protein [Kovacikia minuta]UBF28611.1 low-complexity tail membrane protein [Kovacikia minuta CCNUW1]